LRFIGEFIPTVTLGSEDQIRCCTPASFEPSANLEIGLPQTIKILISICCQPQVTLIIGHPENRIRARYGFENRILII
jgi:hypothetical protein